MAPPVDYRDLLARLRAYRDDRDWEQFHTPADLAVAVTVEAGELLEHFLWQTSRGAREPVADRSELLGEIADVGIYLLFLCDSLDADLLEVIERKLDHNLARHPVQATRGRSRPDV